MVAVQSRNENSVKSLLAHGAHVNAANTVSTVWRLQEVECLHFHYFVLMLGDAVDCTGWNNGSLCGYIKGP